MQLPDVQGGQQRGHCVGLVGGIQRRVDAAIRADVIKGDDPPPRRIQRAARAHQRVHPAALGEFRGRREVTVGGDAAGHEHRGRVFRTQAFPRQAHGPAAAVAQVQFQRQHAADGVDGRSTRHRRRHREAGRGDGDRGGLQQAHGTSDLQCGKAIDAHGEPVEESMRAPFPARIDNHLPVDTQVPAGLGTFLPGAALRPQVEVAPASKGLSLRRSRWMERSWQRPPRMSIASCE